MSEIGDIREVHESGLSVGIGGETNDMLVGTPFIVILEDGEPKLAVNLAQAFGLIEAISQVASVAIYG